jgi:hypothetical protein
MRWGADEFPQNQCQTVFFLLKGGVENILGLAKCEIAKRHVARELVLGADK